MRVLVTGAAGFLGRHVVEAALARGHDVRAVLRPSSPALLPAAAEVVRLDLRTTDGLQAALDGVDLVVHAAAVKSGDFHTQFAGTVAGTRNLLQEMGTSAVRRLVLVSSFSVYDYERLPAGATVDESTPLARPATARDAYAATKLLQEEVVESAARAPGWRVVVARPGVIYGEGNLWSARLGYELRDGSWLCVGGRARLPLTYVGNCADALLHLGERAEPGVSRVNIVDDEPPTQSEYRAALARRTGRPPHVRVVPWPLAHAAVASLDRLNRWLGTPLALPGAFRLDAAIARWQRFEYSNRRLRSLGWHAPMDFDSALTKATGGAGSPAVTGSSVG